MRYYLANLPGEREAIEDELRKNARGHVWQMDGNSIDLFAMDADYHNGPACILCGYEFCHHCHSFPLTDCPYSTTVSNLDPSDLYELEQT